RAVRVAGSPGGKARAGRGGAVRAAARGLPLRPAILHELAGKGRFLLASCDEGESSVEAEELHHGLFTYHLLRGLEGAGDRDGDGKVGVAELFEYVSAAVERDARETYGLRQRPWSQATHAGGVYLSAPRGGRSTVAPAATQPEATPAALERLWRDEGAAAAVAVIERRLRDAPEAVAVPLLRLLRKMADPLGVPAVFRCLPHDAEAVRE